MPQQYEHSTLAKEPAEIREVAAAGGDDDEGGDDGGDAY